MKRSFSEKNLPGVFAGQVFLCKTRLSPGVFFFRHFKGMITFSGTPDASAAQHGAGHAVHFPLHLPHPAVKFLFRHWFVPFLGKMHSSPYKTNETALSINLSIKDSPDCSGLSLVWGRMKGPQPLHVESAGAALLPRGAPMALPLSISARKNRVSGFKPKTHFFKKWMLRMKDCFSWLSFACFSPPCRAAARWHGRA